MFNRKKKNKDNREWKPLDTVPLNTIVELACETYDCGWTFFYGWTKGECETDDSDDGYNFEGRKIFYVSAPILEVTMPVSHLTPDLWREAPNDAQMPELNKFITDGRI